MWAGSPRTSNHITKFGMTLIHVCKHRPSVQDLACFSIFWMSADHEPGLLATHLAESSGESSRRNWKAKLAFTVLGAVAELERSLIAERVRAGIRNVRAKGKRIGRPRVAVDPARIAALRAQGRSWSEVCSETGVGKGTAQRAFSTLP